MHAVLSVHNVKANKQKSIVRVMAIKILNAVYSSFVLCFIRQELFMLEEHPYNYMDFVVF